MNKKIKIAFSAPKMLTPEQKIALRQEKVKYGLFLGTLLY